MIAEHNLNFFFLNGIFFFQLLVIVVEQIQLAILNHIYIENFYN
jgi:hypothetical protein